MAHSGRAKDAAAAHSAAAKSARITHSANACWRSTAAVAAAMLCEHRASAKQRCSPEGT
jgi:hypothetical protein